ncbi:MAG: hypothetical protein V4501_07410 [Pseudomonadota bacterium]
MLRKALQSNIGLFTSQKRHFIGYRALTPAEANTEFHKQNVKFYVDLRFQGMRSPVCPAYLKSREFLFNANQKGQSDIDTPAGDSSYLTREELTKYPTPKDFLMKDNGLGLIEAIKRFPDAETSSPANDSTSNNSTRSTPRR